MIEKSETKIFGISLEEVMKRDGRFPNFILSALEEIEKNGLEVVGIFRLSGASKEVHKLKFLVDSGLIIDFSEERDIHNITVKISNFFFHLFFLF